MLRSEVRFPKTQTEKEAFARWTIKRTTNSKGPWYRKVGDFASMQVFLHPTLYTEGNGLGSLRYIKSKAFNNAFLLSCGYLFGSVVFKNVRGVRNFIVFSSIPLAFATYEFTYFAGIANMISAEKDLLARQSRIYTKEIDPENSVLKVHKKKFPDEVAKDEEFAMHGRLLMPGWVVPQNIPAPKDQRKNDARRRSASPNISSADTGRPARDRRTKGSSFAQFGQTADAGTEKWRAKRQAREGRFPTSRASKRNELETFEEFEPVQEYDKVEDFTEPGPSSPPGARRGTFGSSDSGWNSWRNETKERSRVTEPLQSSGQSPAERRRAAIEAYNRRNDTTSSRK